MTCQAWAVENIAQSSVVNTSIEIAARGIALGSGPGTFGRFLFRGSRHRRDKRSVESRKLSRESTFDFHAVVERLLGFHAAHIVQLGDDVIATVWNHQLHGILIVDGEFFATLQQYVQTGAAMNAHEKRFG